MPPSEPLSEQRVRAFALLGAAALLLVFLGGTARAEDGKPAAPAGAGARPAGPEEKKPADPAEGKPARPPPLPPLEGKPLPWERLLEVGGSFALVARPATGDAMGNKSSIRYEPATGFGLHIRWPVIKYLRVEGYFVDCHHSVTIPSGALGLADEIVSPPVETFVLGLRLSPSLTWGRFTSWLTAGLGWGRLEFQRMNAVPVPGDPYELRERGASFIEFPIGLGVAFELIPRWLSIELQGTAAFVAGQRGEAFSEAQTVVGGKIEHVKPLPIMDASLVQTIGFSLLL